MRMLKVRVGLLKSTYDTHVIHTKKKRSLRCGKLEANRASETEEQRKERLRIGREKDRRPRETAPYHSQKIEAR